MKRLLLLLFFMAFCSCEYFDKKRISSKEILSEEIKELNWQEVDRYPAFEECKEILESEAAKNCFEDLVSRYFFSYLKTKEPVVTVPLEDTLYIYLRISDEGVPSIDTVEVDRAVVRQLPEIRMWLTESVNALPRIYPATKRGIPVITTFKMPVVIRAN